MSLPPRLQLDRKSPQYTTESVEELHFNDDPINSTTQKLRNLSISTLTPRSNSSTDSPRDDNNETSSSLDISHLREMVTLHTKSASDQQVNLAEHFFNKECKSLFQLAFDQQPINDLFLQALTKLKSIPRDIFNNLIEMKMQTLTIQDLNKIKYIVRFCCTPSSATKSRIQTIDNTVCEQIRLRYHADAIIRTQVDNMLHVVALSAKELLESPIFEKHLQRNMPGVISFLSHFAKYYAHCSEVPTQYHEKTKIDLAMQVYMSLKKLPFPIDEDKVDSVLQKMADARAQPMTKDLFSEIYTQVLFNVATKHFDITVPNSFWTSRDFAQYCIENDLPMFEFTPDILNLYK